MMEKESRKFLRWHNRLNYLGITDEICTGISNRHLLTLNNVFCLDWNNGIMDVFEKKLWNNEYSVITLHPPSRSKY